MKRRRPNSSKALRHAAEDRLQKREADSHDEADVDAVRLLHELKVHQIELEMQNEELRVARQEAQNELVRYTELFDFAPIGYLRIAGNGAIREANFASARLLGKARPQLIGRNLEWFVSLDERARFRDLLKKIFYQTVVEGNHEWPAEAQACELRLKEATVGRRDVRISAVISQRDRSTALVAMEDITGRKLAEAALREESRHKDDFLSALSHELRNPLAPISNSLFVLERVEADTEQARKAHAVVNRQVMHLTRIIDDLLDVTRIARGKVSLRKERLELGELVRRTVDDYRPSFEASGVRLESRLAPERFWVNADAVRLTQVLGNLLVNAVKFTSRGGIVEVNLQAQEKTVVLEVRDTGVGIAQEMLGHLFEPFRQVQQSLDRTRGGLGLGLAMVKGLVELHQGTVEAASEGLGRGARFTIKLPLDADGAGVRPMVSKRPVRRFRVLVIEDNVDAADSLREALEVDHHQVRVAYDGPTGIAMARVFRPQIIVCDIGLPGMDGYDVARVLRAEESLNGVHLIALSGYALPDDIQRAAEAGFDHHVAKPPNLDELEQLFERAQLN